MLSGFFSIFLNLGIVISFGYTFIARSQKICKERSQFMVKDRTYDNAPEIFLHGRKIETLGFMFLPIVVDYAGMVNVTGKNGYENDQPNMKQS